MLFQETRLFERTNVRQIEGEGRRRWFSGEGLDLIVWYEMEGVRGFQLCYLEGAVERAFTWIEGRGCSLQRVDDGEEPGHVKQSPILVGDRGGDITALLTRFQRAAPELDPDLRALVTARLRDYATRTAGRQKVHAGGG